MRNNMRLISDTEWRERHPRWRVWHTALLYISAAGLVVGGLFIVHCAGVYDAPDPVYVLFGFPFVMVGAGLILRIPAVIWLVAGLCVVHSSLASVRILMEAMSIPGNVGWMKVIPFYTAELMYGILMFIGLSRRRQK